MSEAILYRDSDYGALAIYREGSGIITIDHGFVAEDFAVVLDLLEAKCRTEDIRGSGVSFWSPDSHRESLLLDIDNALRERGYVLVKHAPRAIIGTTVESARSPDLPEDASITVNEVVERALRRHVEVAWGVLGGAGAVSEAEVRFFPRPNTRDGLGRPLPFLRARALVAAEDVSALSEGLSKALRPIEGSIVRASVEEVAEGRFAVEIAVAPPLSACEAFLDEVLPTFESADICGSRSVHFALNAQLSEESLADLRDRAAACTAATGITAPDSRNVIACVPAGYRGDAAFDSLFNQRVAWLMEELDEYDPDIEGISEMRDVIDEVQTEPGTVNDSR